MSILSGLFLSSQGALAAKYQVKEIGATDSYRHHFAIDLNDQGELIGVVRDSFNFPFYEENYLTALTVNGLSCDVTDEEMSTGNYDDFSSSCLKLALTNNGANALYQKVGDNKSFAANAGVAEIVNLVDVFDAELGDYTRSNTEQVRAINEQGMIVGFVSAPYLPFEFTQSGENATTTEPSKYWQREYSTRASVYINGEVKLLEPEYTLYGGETEANGISDSGYVAGVTSVSMPQATIDSIEETCDDELVPKSVCIWSRSISASSSIYEVRPIVWKLDANGNVESKQVYGLAFEPTEDQTGNYFANSMSVNDLGVAVGFGNVFRDNTLLTMPLIFQNSETKTFVDSNEFDSGYASGISDAGVVIGTVQKFFDNTFNNEFFVYDINSGNFETPDTFYQQAESFANDINDAGMVVGEAEYEVTTSPTRRKHGFLYNSVTKEFFDLNDLTECGSTYEIVETKAINNNEQIAATALKLVDKKDALGEVILDDNGNPEQEEVAVAVMLEPIAGEIDDCSEIEDPAIERKGPANSLLLSLGLFALAAFRRCLAKN